MEMGITTLIKKNKGLSRLMFMVGIFVVRVRLSYLSLDLHANAY